MSVSVTKVDWVRGCICQKVIDSICASQCDDGLLATVIHQHHVAGHASVATQIGRNNIDARHVYLVGQRFEQIAGRERWVIRRCQVGDKRDAVRCEQTARFPRNVTPT